MNRRKSKGSYESADHFDRDLLFGQEKALLPGSSILEDLNIRTLCVVSQTIISLGSDMPKLKLIAF